MNDAELNKQVLEERDRRPLGRTMLCQNCIYWTPLGSFDQKELDEDNAKGPFSDIFAECRRRAPVPLQHIILHTGQMTAQVAFAVNVLAKIKINEHDDYEMGSVYEDQVHEWPMTNANDWCGEFVERCREATKNGEKP
jgi:hypothetical protein